MLEIEIMGKKYVEDYVKKAKELTTLANFLRKGGVKGAASNYSNQIDYPCIKCPYFSYYGCTRWLNKEDCAAIREYHGHLITDEQIKRS